MEATMNITYFGKFNNNKYADLIEKPISEALKNLGHKVYEFDVMTADAKELVKRANKSDIFLFHNGGIEIDPEKSDELRFYMGITGLQNLLNQITCQKVMWYFDRVIGAGEELVERILPLIDCGFFNDDTWVRRHKWENAYGLHMGTIERPDGQFRKDLECDIAFIGRVYGGREEILTPLKQRYGRKFRIFGDIWGKDFDDLCQSAKIIFQPKWLNNDFCWTGQIYQVLGAEGFLVHPRLYGLKEEGFDEGTHYVGYTIYEELLAGLDFFLKPENDEKRKLMAKQGKMFVLTNFRWEERFKTIFEIIKNKLIK